MSPAVEAILAWGRALTEIEKYAVTCHLQHYIHRIRVRLEIRGNQYLKKGIRHQTTNLFNGLFVPHLVCLLILDAVVELNRKKRKPPAIIKALYHALMNDSHRSVRDGRDEREDGCVPDSAHDIHSQPGSVGMK